MNNKPLEYRIKIGYYCFPVNSLGPGNRFVLWTKGCNRSCFRCASPNLQSTTGGVFYSTVELIELMKQSNCSGLTVSGGEPLIQAQSVFSLLQDVRIFLPEWDIILFTGFLFDEIDNNIRSKLSTLVDLLIDGPYIDSLNDDLGLRGSSNQKYYFFTERLQPFAKELESHPHPRRQLYLLSDEEMISVGIAPPREKYI